MNDHFLYLAAGILLGAALMLSIRTHWLEGAAVVDGALAELPDAEPELHLILGVPEQRQPIEDRLYNAEEDGL